MAASPPRRDPALDGLRAFAVLLIFLYHYGGGLMSPSIFVEAIGYVVEFSWVGVPLFFALSGFLITGSLWDSIGKLHYLRNFFARRALRILPLYYSALLLAAFVSRVRGASFAELKPLAVYAFFLQDMPYLAAKALANTSPLPLYHLWTVAVEVQFYLLWPLLLVLPRRRRTALNLSLLVFFLAAVFRVVVYGLPKYAALRDAKIFDSFLITHIGSLALGSALALAVRSSRNGRKSASSRWVYKHATGAFIGGLAVYATVSAFALSFTLFLSTPLQYMLGLPAISVAAVALIPMVLRLGPPRSLFSNRFLVGLGRLSYGFYIFHLILQPIFDFFAFRICQINWGYFYQIVRLLVAFLITLLVSWLSYRVFELPFLQRKHDFPMAPPLTDD